MNENLDAKEQLAEIQGHIAETRPDRSGAGAIGGVWGALSVAAILILLFAHLNGPLQLALWATHNALGWAFTLYWTHRDWRRTGRKSARDRLTLRLWAMLTLPVWLSILVLANTDGAANSLTTFFVVLWLGAGVFGTGLLHESSYSQGIAVAWMVAAAGCALGVSPPLSNVLLLCSAPVFTAVWAMEPLLAAKSR